MLRLIVALVLLCNVFGDHTYLLWSDSGLTSLQSLTLGANLSPADFNANILQPICTDHKIVQLDVPNVSFKELAQIGGNGNNEWSNMKSLLQTASMEKLFAVETGVGGPPYPNCDYQRVEVTHNPAEGQASVVVDGKIKQEVEKQNSVDNSKPVVYLLRILSKDEQESNVARRSAVAANGDDSSQFVISKCHRFYADKVQFQPLRPLFVDKDKKNPVKRFVVNGWVDDGSECDKDAMQKYSNMTIKMRADDEGAFTDIKLQLVVKAYEKFGTSGKSFKYWYADTMKLSYTYNGNPEVARISPGYIAAPQNNSYACQKPDNQALRGAKANLLFTNLQFDVNMFIDGTPPEESATFNDGVDCEARLGKGGVIGLFFIVIVLLATLYIIAMLSSAKNPVFGDKQIVVNQE